MKRIPNKETKILNIPKPLVAVIKREKENKLVIK